MQIIAIQAHIKSEAFREASEIGKGLFDAIGAINGLIVGGTSHSTEFDEPDAGISQSDIDSLFD